MLMLFKDIFSMAVVVGIVSKVRLKQHQLSTRKEENAK